MNSNHSKPSQYSVFSKNGKDVDLCVTTGSSRKETPSNPMLERWFQEPFKDGPYHNLGGVGSEMHGSRGIGALRGSPRYNAGNKSERQESAN